jgi:sugar O-acyltransferase (sialic acid O-acetyltransferase NeuD family)
MKRALFGYGGHAREVAAHINEEILFFVDDSYWNEGDINVLPFSKFDPKEFEIMVSVANSNHRKTIVDKLPKSTKFFSFIHPSSIILSEVSLGFGSFIGANCILTTNIRIGNHAILNRNVNIGHDCVIGDYFSGMPGSVISGNVNTGNCLYMGNNSSLKEKIKICDDVVIGMNCSVVKNVNEPGTYVGVPVTKIK